MSETSTSVPASAGPSGRRWLLVGSLALNLLFIGGLAALWVHGPPGLGHRGPSQTAFGLMKFSRDLPPDRREAVRKHLKDARQGLKDLRAELRAARQKASEVLASSSYSAEQMQAALAAVANAENRMRDVGSAALVKAIAELTPDERQKLAEAWNRRLQKEQRRTGKSGKDDPGEGPDDPPGPP